MSDPALPPAAPAAADNALDAILNDPKAAGGRADTTPDCQEPPDREIDAAKRDIPRTLNAMTNFECANPVPLRGHRIVQCTQLVDELCKRNHPADAAKWAIHRLIQEGMLQAEICDPGKPFTIGGWKGEITIGNTPVVPSGPVALDELVLRSTDALWAWHPKGQQPDQGADAAHDQDRAGQVGGADREKTEATPAVEPEQPEAEKPKPPQAPSFDDEEVSILKALSDVAPLLCDTTSIEQDCNISRKTVGQRLGRLIELGLAHRPKGERKGATITSTGAELLAKLRRPKDAQ